MIKLFIFLILFFPMIVVSQSNPCGGTERWNVKVLTDSLASKVKTKAISTTITKLRAIPVPGKIGNSTPRFPEECKTYSVICKITLYKSEDDKDYHIVLADTSDITKTVISEMPNPDCDSVAKSKFAKTYAIARKQFESYIISRKAVLPGVYRVTGVLFFDKIHGQTGVAPNGIELHPILKIEKLR